MTARKVYIAGPMRGLPQFNFPAFHAAEARLRAEGTWAEICNPAAWDSERHGVDIGAGNETGDEALAASQHGFSLREALALDMGWIARTATAIFMLEGWSRSSGARAELALAQALGLEVLYESPAARREMTPAFAQGWNACADHVHAVGVDELRWMEEA